MISYIVISDIHGCAEQLRILLGQSNLFTGRRAVFLGDYVDVGPDSKTVLELLIDFRDSNQSATFLRGNHECELMSFLEGGSFVKYAEIGGTATIRAYCGEVEGDVRKALAKAVPPKHIAFLEGSKIYLETENHLFSHCGYDPDQPLDRSEKSMARQSHQRLFSEPPAHGKTVVCGHYLQRSRKPFISKNVVCLDTGCGVLGGPLTAMLFPERRVIQVTSGFEVLIHEAPESTA